MYGVVEGFYGPTWDWVDRLSLVEFMNRVGMDTYIYAPKWDPYHRDWWRVPYGSDFGDRLVMLVDAASRYGVRVVFAISPGLDIDYSSGEDLNTLLRKLSWVMDRGIRDLALLLDDIPPVLRGRGFRTLAEAQATLVNTVLRELEPTSLIFCPTYYYGLVEEYMTEVGRLLDPEVHIMWTGMWVASYKIDVDDLESISRLLGRKPFIWDNYPVNDYFVVNGITRLHVGPLRNRPADIGRYVSGYVANPANQFEVSKIPLYTAAEEVTGGGSYDPERSLRAAVDYVVNRAARYWFSRFVEFNRASFMDLEEATVTRDSADEVLEVVRGLRETLRSRKLLKEIEPVLNKMVSIARYAKGEAVPLSWRVQTAGEYSPPITNKRMEREVFGVVARRIPWYAKAYVKPEV